MIGIYRYTNLINGKRYIGQSIDIESRYKAHLYGSEHITSSFLEMAIKKYGINNFKFEVLEFCEPEELDELEQYWIEYYQTFCFSSTYNGYGYNKTIGGQGGTGFRFQIPWNKGKKGCYTDEQIQRISTGTIIGMHKPDAWERYMNSKPDITGDKNPFYGKHHTEETKRRIKETKTGTKMPDETKEYWKNQRTGAKWMHKGDEEYFVYKDKIDEYLKNGFEFGRNKSVKEKIRGTNLGRKDSPETLEKKRNAFIGSNNPNYGKRWKIDKTTRKRIFIEE